MADLPRTLSERQRLTRIYEPWSRWSRQPLGSAGWRTVIEENFGSLVMIIGVGFSIASTPFDLGFWIPRLEPYDLGLWALTSDPRIEVFFQSLPATWVLAALGLLFLLNGRIVGHLLSRWDPPSGVPLWVRYFRSWIGALPGIGLSVLPLWMTWRGKRASLATTQPALVVPPQRSPRVLILHLRGWLDRGVRGLTSLDRLGTLFILNCVVVFIAGNQLAWPRQPNPERATALLTLCGVLHLLAWLNMAFWFSVLARRFSPSHAKRPGWRLQSLLWLLPVPYLAALGSLLIFSRESRSGQPRTLIQALHETSHSIRGVASWTRLEAALRSKWTSAPWWRRWRQRPQSLDLSPTRSDVEERVLRLCRRKILALGFEAALLTLTLAALARMLGFEEELGAVGAAFAVVFWLSLSAAALGLLRQAWGFFAFWARVGNAGSDLKRDAAVSIFAASQLAWAGGLLAGARLANANITGLGEVLVLAGGVGLFLQAGPIFLRLVAPVPFPVIRDPRKEAPLLLLFTAFLVCGMTMAKDEATAGIYAVLLVFATVSSPLWGAISGGLCLPWLLRPFSINDRLSGRLGYRHQLLRLGLAMTVVLPLGGLVSSWWVLVHRDQPQLSD